MAAVIGRSAAGVAGPPRPRVFQMFPLTMKNFTEIYASGGGLLVARINEPH